MEPHADLMPWKRSSVRSSGQPEAADCSGKAGMVAGGGRWSVWVWTVAGSGSGKMGRAGIDGGRWKNVEKRKRNRNMMPRDMALRMLWAERERRGREGIEM